MWGSTVSDWCVCCILIPVWVDSEANWVILPEKWNKGTIFLIKMYNKLYYIKYIYMLVIPLHTFQDHLRILKNHVAVFW